jgi:hypothetical protein
MGFFDPIGDIWNSINPFGNGRVTAGTPTVNGVPMRPGQSMKPVASERDFYLALATARSARKNKERAAKPKRTNKASLAEWKKAYGIVDPPKPKSRNYASAPLSYTPPRINIDRNSFRRSAAEAVAFQLNGQINALRRQANEARREWATADTDLRRRQSQADSDLAYLGGALNDRLKSLQGQTVAKYGEARKATDKNFASLEGDLTAQNAAADAAVANESARLGLSNGQPVELEARRNQDQDFLMGLAKNNRAQAAALLQNQETSYNALANEMRAGEQANFANKRAGVKQVYAEKIGQLRLENNRTLRMIAGQQSDIEATRNYQIQQRMDQMAAAAQEAAERRAQQDFQNQMAVNNFNLSNAKFAYDQEYDAAQLSLQKGRLQLDAEKAKQAALKQAAQSRGEVTGLPAAQSYVNNQVNMGELSQQAGYDVLRYLSAFDRGDAFATDTLNANKDSNKSAIQDWIRTQLEAENRLQGGDRLAAMSAISGGLDAYWGGY